jgi:bla regulator protein blaR1
MIGELTNHLWQTTVFAAAAGLLTLAFRKNRAQVRFCLWLSASLKFLVPFSLLISLGTRVWDALPGARSSTQLAVGTVSQTVVQITQPFSENFVHVTAVRHTTNWIPFAIFATWFAGFIYVLLMRLHGWLVIRAAMRASKPMDVAASISVQTAPGVIEPGVVGFVRPVLVLPEGIAHELTAAQMDAVIAHEQAHIRRRDNLTSALHMIVEAIFWFHPAVWWIGAKLVEERERACDEAVLTMGNEPHVYAEGILNVCKSYLESPLRCVSGVSGADLKKRIRAILHGRIAGELSFGKKMALAAAAAAVIAAPVLVGVFGAPMLRAQSAAAERPRFEVASIRQCDANSEPGAGPGGGRNGGGGAGGGAGVGGRLDMPCSTLAHMIEVAYLEYATGERPATMQFLPLPIEGAPDWVSKTRYQIHAETEVGSPSPFMMRGPMLQTLLEDRFQLKLHRETGEEPVYEIIVARGGPKLPAFDGSCTLVDYSKPLEPLAVPPGENHKCTIHRHVDGSNWAIDAPGMTLAYFAHYLSGMGLGRPVIDKTGITDRVNIHLEFTSDQTMTGLQGLEARGGRGDDNPNASPNASSGETEAFPDIFTAFQRLGLELKPTKGPGDFLVIDHVERPSGN